MLWSESVVESCRCFCACPVFLFHVDYSCRSPDQSERIGLPGSGYRWRVCHFPQTLLVGSSSTDLIRDYRHHSAPADELLYLHVNWGLCLRRTVYTHMRETLERLRHRSRYSGHMRITVFWNQAQLVPDEQRVPQRDDARWT